jgi:hypothetical protein
VLDPRCADGERASTLRRRDPRRQNILDAELLNDAMTIMGSDATGVAATAKLALIGDELIQFGPRLFRPGGLLRGGGDVNG